jgi:hypothetical protein
VTVLTLDRVVSLRDYEDFARSYPGIAKAAAAWDWDGRGRGLILTVAGSAGDPVDPAGELHGRLLQALRGAGDPFVGVRLASYRRATFRLGLRVKVRPDHLPEKVLPAVEAALRAAFGFDARPFAEPVRLSEVIAVAHGVPGVEAVDVERLYRATPPADQPSVRARLVPEPARPAPDGLLLGAELLTLDPGPLEPLDVTG